jgi:uncharacterized membrane protein YoaK (UPF0700 family)
MQKSIITVRGLTVVEREENKKNFVVTALQNRTKKEFYFIAFGGAVLSFNAGMINATSQAGNYDVSTAPMTGAVTNMAIGIGNGDAREFGLALGILISHMLGSGIAGYLLPKLSFRLAIRYGVVLSIICVLLSGTAVVHYYLPDSYIWPCMLAGCTGVQNAMTSRYD